MVRPINDDIAYKGSTLVLGIKFPPVDGKYTFTELVGDKAVKVVYYIINARTKTEHEVTNDLYKAWDETETPEYANMFAFTVDTSDLVPGVLMVEILATIPLHDNLPLRLEIARCSSGIAIME